MKNWKLVIGHWSFRKGFSLIELVFAMLFLTIIILGVISLQSSNLAMINSQNNEMQAHFYANQGIAIAEAIGYDDLVTANCVTCKIIPPDPIIVPPTLNYAVSDLGDIPEEIDGLFERSFNLNNALTDAYQVTMNVEWEDSTGGHEVSAKRIISN